MTSQDPKPTGNQDFDLLIKLMNMTTSDNDNISLVSIRKANDLLKRKGFDWDSVLRGRVKIVQDPFAVTAQASQPVQATMARRQAPQSPPPPRPAPQPRQTWTPPPKAPPNPASAPASTTFSTFSKRPNSYDAGCWSCGCKVPSGKGYLDGKFPSGKTRVHCDTGWGCETIGRTTKAQRQKQRPDMDTILDILS